MKFCDECGALLVPKKEKKSNKVVFVCRKCGNKVTPESEEVGDYVITSDLHHVNRDKIEVVKESRKVKRITNEDREAFEDFFDDDSGVESY